MMHMAQSTSEHLLQSNLIMSSSDVDEVRAKVADELSEHRLEPRTSGLNARLFGAKADGVQLYLLEYGGAVAVDASLGRDSILVQCGLHGSVNARCSLGQWHVASGQTSILPPGISLHLDWEAHAAQLLVKISLERLNRAYDNLVGATSLHPLRFRHAMVQDTSSMAGWDVLLGYFCSQLLAAGGQKNALTVKVAEDALIGHLLCSQSLDARDGTALRRNIAPKYVRRAREFMEARVQDTISLEDIAAYAGVSVRSLSRAYQEQYDTSPMTALRAMRLDKIREDLAISGMESSVADIAFRWGYTHLGRFAAAYRERFGEAPNQTLRRAKYTQHVLS